MPSKSLFATTSNRDIGGLGSIGLYSVSKEFVMRILLSLILLKTCADCVQIEDGKTSWTLDITEKKRSDTKLNTCCVGRWVLSIKMDPFQQFKVPRPLVLASRSTS